jgi:hypothetical protein
VATTSALLAALVPPEESSACSCFSYWANCFCSAAIAALVFGVVDPMVDSMLTP